MCFMSSEAAEKWLLLDATVQVRATIFQIKAVNYHSRHKAMPESLIAILKAM